MATLPLKAQIVREALRGIGQVIDGLSRPADAMPGARSAPKPKAADAPASYVLDSHDHGRVDQPPGLWPEMLEVREALMGAAFVVAQEHVGNAALAQLHHDIEHIANYWKHRGDWGGQWQSANRHTLAGIKSLNGGSLPEKSPVELGELSELAQKALKQPFTSQALWEAIADVP